MTYFVKEIFKTLQGEGAQTGRVAIFCRFAGCNLWSGREADRVSSICTFCDTDFIGTDGCNGGKFASTSDLVDVICGQWGSDIKHRNVAIRTYNIKETKKGCRSQVSTPSHYTFHGGISNP
jgi:7-carboxy-7-deazaguanine synthase